MPRQGLTTQSVVSAAADLIEKTGWEQLSLHKLAVHVGVRTASLYTHIDSLGHLRTLLSELALQRLRRALQEAIAQRTPDVAVRCLCFAYCAFARENPEQYRAIMAVPHSGNPLLVEAGRSVKAVLLDLLAAYTTDHALQIQLSRQLHSLLHGFVGLERLGFFDAALSTEDSFSLMVDDFIQRLRGVGSRDMERGEKDKETRNQVHGDR